jgi:hypothetical protein
MKKDIKAMGINFTKKETIKLIIFFSMVASLIFSIIGYQIGKSKAIIKEVLVIDEKRTKEQEARSKEYLERSLKPLYEKEVTVKGNEKGY